MHSRLDLPNLLLLPAEARFVRSVSPLSMWMDDVWRFPNPAPGAVSKTDLISFAFPMHDGSLFSDQQWSGLREMARCFVWSLLNANQRGRNVKPNGRFEAVQFLLVWMGSRCYDSFGQLDAVAAADYERAVIDEKGQRWSEDDDAVVGRITYQAVAQYLDVLVKLYQQGPILEGIAGAVMPSRPYGGQAVAALAARAELLMTERIPPLPQQVYRAVTAECADWLGSKADTIIEAQEAHLRMAARHRSATSNSYHKHLNTALVATDELGWLFKQPDSARGPIALLRAAVDDLRGASENTIQAGVGLRPSELCSLDALPMHPGDGVPSDDASLNIWPHCVRLERSIDGVHEIFLIRGRMVKAQPSPVVFSWTAGARETGTDYVPLPVRAIMVLVRLYRPWRSLTRSNDLAFSFQSPGGFPTKGKLARGLTTKTALRAQRNFIERWVRLPTGFAASNLRGHSWRKSFADNVVAIDAALHPALSEHLGHLREGITFAGYTGDPAAVRTLDGEAMRYAGRVTYMIASGRMKAAGRAAEALVARAKDILEDVDTDNIENGTAQMTEYVKDEGVRLWNQEWGACLFMCERSRCHFLARGDFDATATAPHLATRSPDTCRKCGNLLIIEEHKPFWLERYNHSMAIVANNEREGLEDVLPISRRRATQAATILRQLGEEVPAP